MSASPSPVQSEGFPSSPGSASGLIPSEDSVDFSEKLAQLIQNLFFKAAYIVIYSRMTLSPIFRQRTGTIKVNTWFNLELDETEAFKDDLRPWKALDRQTRTATSPSHIFSSIPPLIIETVLDTSALTPKQILVLLDSAGARWNVEAAAAARGMRHPEIVLERWRINLNPRAGSSTESLPTIYKKAAVVFRTLHSYAYLLPAWRFRRKVGKTKLNPLALKLSCRVLNGAYAISSAGRIGLSIPLITNEQDNHLESLQFSEVETTAGIFTVQVSYRKNCDFRVDDSESILSLHFLDLDQIQRREGHGGQKTSTGSSQPGSIAGPVPMGSLPSQVRPSSSFSSLHSASLPDSTMAYGSSMPMQSQVSTSNASAFMRPVVQPRAVRNPSISSITQGIGRPIQPFKTRTLSESPSSDSMNSAMYPKLSYHRIASSSSSSSSVGGTMRPRGSSTSGFQGGLIQHTISPGSARNVIPSNSSVSPTTGSTPPLSASPNARRYSSSFGSRSQWLSQGAVPSSPGRSSSLTRRGMFPDSPVPSANSKLILSATPEEEQDPGNIDDFMRLLHNVKPLKSISIRANRSREASSSPESGRSANSNALMSLQRFRNMRDSHAMLTESMTSSFYYSGNAASSGASSGSGQFVGPRISPNTGVTSGAIVGSAGTLGITRGGVSPAQAHTPAIPSRLSEVAADRYRHAAVFDEDEDEERGRRTGEEGEDEEEERETGEDVIEEYNGVNSGSGQGPSRGRRRAGRSKGEYLQRYLGGDNGGSASDRSSIQQVGSEGGDSKDGSGGMPNMPLMIDEEGATRGRPGSVGGMERHSNTGPETGDDDELLFAMSDMNLVTHEVDNEREVMKLNSAEDGENNLGGE
ncbi:autophagy-related protein 13-domain-containing protein [Lipomyces oligophaga]|uniref:autophagy-related protein 13-domain-containing protein n=1 Tax=Lipomyces oligophaga TaxID=45792 RepID=UPI0034CD7B07